MPSTKADILVVIPAYDEAENLKALFDHKPASADYDFVIVDDSSTDATRAIAEQHGVVLSLAVRLGAWGATQTGIRYGITKGYNLIVTMDADGQHRFADIPALLCAMTEEKADVVIGSYPDRGSRARQIAWWLFRQLSGVRLEDLTSGLKMYNKQAACHLAKADATIFDYQDLGIILYLLGKGMKITEKEVVMRERRDGKSRVFNTWLLVLKYMLQTIILCICMRKLKETPGQKE